MLLTVIDSTSESISTLLRCNRRSLFTTLESHLLEYSLHYNSILLSFNFCKSLTTNLIISIMKKRRWYPLDSNPGPQVSKDGKQRRIQWAMEAFCVELPNQSSSHLARKWISNLTFAAASWSSAGPCSSRSSRSGHAGCKWRWRTCRSWPSRRWWCREGQARRCPRTRWSCSRPRSGSRSCRGFRPGHDLKKDENFD